MTPIQDPFIAELVQDLRNSPAGQLLTQHGFEVVHQGGYIVNYEKTWSDGSVTVICASDGDGSGPTDLAEGIEVYVRNHGSEYDEPLDQWMDADLRDFLADMDLNTDK